MVNDVVLDLSGFYSLMCLVRTFGECICGEIVGIVPLAQSTVSQHLRELKKAGLIKGRIFGPKSYYCINWEVLNQFRSAFEAFSGLMDVAEKAAEPLRVARFEVHFVCQHLRFHCCYKYLRFQPQNILNDPAKQRIGVARQIP